MTDAIAPQPPNRRQPSLNQRSLNFEDHYRCPLCRHGEIAALPLMDAFSCNFCRHIFTANLKDQTVCVEDSSQKTTWRWNGLTWQLGNEEAIELTWAIRIGSVLLVLLPPLIIWLPSYIFPPLDGSNLDWLPNAWVWLTFFVHLGMVSWLLVEYYQFPPYVALKVRLGDLFDRR